MIGMSIRMFVVRLAALGVLLVALSAQPAWAQGGGTPDPSDIPTLQALRVEVNALDQRFLVLTATVEASDLYPLKRLADRLARLDGQFTVTAIGGGQPDPSNTTLNQALLELRAETVELRSHVASVLSVVAGNPIFDLITETKTLQFMRATARMLVARINYALPITLAPPSDL